VLLEHGVRGTQRNGLSDEGACDAMFLETGATKKNKRKLRSLDISQGKDLFEAEGHIRWADPSLQQKQTLLVPRRARVR